MSFLTLRPKFIKALRLLMLIGAKSVVINTQKATFLMRGLKTSISIPLKVLWK
nr:MAG TPA: hypothetical protein [Caudoviricetes sp.]